MGGSEPTAARTGQAGNLQLSGFHPHLWKNKEGLVYGGSPDRTPTGANEAQGGQGRTSPALARAPVPDVGQWLRSVVTGHYRYYGVPGNYTALAGFRDHISRLWHRALGRRSQKGHVTWERMARLTTRWLPPAHIYHPQPMARLGVTT